MTDSQHRDAGVPGQGRLALELAKNMASITLDRIGKDGISNAHQNLPLLKRGKSLRELRDIKIGKGDRAVIIAAGPSLHRANVAQQLLSHRFDGAIIATDSAMRYCLRQGIVPDLVVTLDPHSKRIVRWFGDPNLRHSDLEADDYFSRQDMDRAFIDEMRANEEILELLDRHGKHIKLALSTSASSAVVDRALQVGMEIFWWNPMYDDPAIEQGLTRQLFELNGLPCMNAGGNVGSACWMMADAVLGKAHVALTGVDLSYYDGTPYQNTQYYYEAVDLVGKDNLDSMFVRIFNPYMQKWFFTDPAYLWYRNIFLEMAQEADCVTYNCTEGGILFGENIMFVPFEDFLNGKALGRVGSDNG
jgi:hypothetical protein